MLNFSAEELAQIASHGPWPPAALPADAGKAWQKRPATVAFGRSLFADRRWSVDGQARCASCARCASRRMPALAFQDNQRLPHLRNALPASVRNTRSLLDGAQRRWLGWRGEHDSLWAASLAPLLAPAEMGHSITSLAAQVRGTPALARAYCRALGPLPAEDASLVVGVAKALAAYQAGMVSPRTPFDYFRAALLSLDHRVTASPRHRALPAGGTTRAAPVPG